MRKRSERLDSRFHMGIFRPVPAGRPRNIDGYATLGSQDKQNSYSPPLYPRPDPRRVAYYRWNPPYSPRGWNSNLPIEALIRYIVGAYIFLCKNAFFPTDKRRGEKNNSIALNRGLTGSCSDRRSITMLPGVTRRLNDAKIAEEHAGPGSTGTWRGGIRHRMSCRL